jgi:hypothetical protein
MIWVFLGGIVFGAVAVIVALFCLHWLDDTEPFE